MRFLYVFFSLFFISKVAAQSYAFGVKGGLAIGNQRFNNGGSYDNGLLFRYQGDLFIENAPELAESVSFAQVGYHTRGHARRYRRGVGQDASGQLVEVPGYTEAFLFRNVALQLGVKKRNVLNKPQAYYAIALRGEYTLNTNLPKANANSSIYALYFPTDDYVRHFNFGLTLSGGYEWRFSELVGGFVDISVQPDITRQYFQPGINNLNYRDPFGNTINSIPEQSIRNLSIEISLGFSFLRKIVYVD